MGSITNRSSGNESALHPRKVSSREGTKRDSRGRRKSSLSPLLISNREKPGLRGRDWLEIGKWYLYSTSYGSYSDLKLSTATFHVSVKAATGFKRHTVLRVKLKTAQNDPVIETIYVSLVFQRDQNFDNPFSETRDINWWTGPEKFPFPWFLFLVLGFNSPC